MIALAVLCGGLAVFLSRSWLDMQASQRLSEIEQAKPAISATTLVVADQPLRFGAQLQSNLLREVPWPADSLPAGAYRTIAELLEGEPRVVLSPLERNEPVLAAKLTGPGQRGTLSAVIRDGMRAVALRVDDVAGVAGFVLPDDRVDVLLTRRNDEGGNITEVILQGARVLAVDQTADQRREDPALARAVTLEVDTRSAQKLALASTIGSLSLVLRRAGETAGEMTRTVTLSDLSTPHTLASLSREMPTNQEAPAETASVPSAVERALARVGVIRAVERAVYSVPTEVVE